MIIEEQTQIFTLIFFDYCEYTADIIIFPSGFGFLSWIFRCAKIPWTIIGICSYFKGKVSWSTYLPRSEGSEIRSTPSESGSALLGLLEVPGTLQLSWSAPYGFGSRLMVVEALSIGPSLPTLVTLVQLLSCTNSEVNFFAKLLNVKFVVLTQLREFYGNLWAFMSFHNFWVNWPFFERIGDDDIRSAIYLWW